MLATFPIIDNRQNLLVTNTVFHLIQYFSFFYFHYSPDHWSYYVNYLNCQIKCHSTGEGSKDGHSSIIEAKDFIKHNKSVEEAKKSGRYRAPFLAELELIWKLREAKLEDVVELG